MKKIGIITWFRHENFGTALQAVALQRYLKTYYETELIDYKIPAPNNKKPSSAKSFYVFSGKIFKKIDNALHKQQLKQKSENFLSFIETQCTISKYVDSKNDYIDLCNSYDILFFGSDQIWNPNWFHDCYYANYKEILTPKVSYAPSFGVSNIDASDESKIKHALKTFNHVSVREKTGIDIVQKATGIEPELVVDPTLLISKKDWEGMENTNVHNNDNYILCYMLTDNKNHWKAIRAFSKKKKMKLVVLPHDGHSLIKSRDVIRNAGPSEFLALIHNANYVITDSYHAVIFSLIYNKKFLIFERHDPNLSGSENSRIYNLLELLNIKDKLLPFNTATIKELDIVLQNSSNDLSLLIDKSKRYIDTAIKEIK